MEITNRQVADKLYFMGQLLEIAGENVFKVRAYYRAADMIERLASHVSDMSEDSLAKINGIGKNIARNIREMGETGTFRELEELKAVIPDSLLELLKLEGVGPKTVHKLWTKLNIQSIGDLEKAARGHRIRALKGFGEKKEAGFLKAISINREQSGRMNRVEADAVVDRVRSILAEGTYEVAGSYRRGTSTIGDIDIVSLESPFGLNPGLRSIAEEIIDEGERRTSIRCLGKRVDVRYSRPEIFGSMLMYLTGSKAFNIRMREIAINKGYKLNEYGIVDRKTGKLNEFSSEEEIFKFLDLEYIVPELREDWGEVKAAMSHTLPSLLEMQDIRGDLHMHSNWSDGKLSIADLSRAGEAMGYEYLVCSDHSATLAVAHGLDEEALKKQSHEIEMTNRDSGCHIIHGIEVDIMADGSLGLPGKVLSDLDIVIASVHSAFGQERDTMTRRVLSAMEHEYVHIIGHPTGRILGRRQPVAIDLSRIIERAAETHTALECNASPYRLDLDYMYIKESIIKGTTIAIGTDSHDIDEFKNMFYGVVTARRGWATPADILNAMTLSSLLEWAG
ncbi:MAG TPA: DNA polymerase/3'-5' exonuclease PolX [Methanoregulaceae archaeon]|nr:DNA polymerase/3'-5' exonuclease PolX [Methanoregulaceae archaeon]